MQMDAQQQPERGFIHRLLIRVSPWVSIGIGVFSLWKWRNEYLAWLREGLNGLWFMTIVILMIGSGRMPVIFRRMTLFVVGLICAGLIYAYWQDMALGLPVLTKIPYSVYVMALTLGVCMYLKQGSRSFYFVLSCGIGLALLLEFIAFISSIGMSGVAAILHFLFIENPLTTFVVLFLPMLAGVWGLSRYISHRRGGF